MLHLIYEGDQLGKLIQKIQEESFLIVDREQAKRMDEEFLYVIQSPEDLTMLDELPRGSRVYLPATLHRNLRRELYPSLCFQRRLTIPEMFPESLTLAGDMKKVLRFIDFLLVHLDFCIGYEAEGWQRELLLNRSVRLQPFSRQCLCLRLKGESSMHLFFDDGKQESLYRYLEERPNGPSILVTRRRMESLAFGTRLCYLSRLPRLREKKVWEMILRWYREQSEKNLESDDSNMILGR